MATPTIAEELAAAESLLTAANEKITALTAELADKGAQIGSLTAELATAKEQQVKANEQHAQVVAAFKQKAKEQADANAKTNAELANAKEILANPAFSKAAANGSTPPPVGGEANVTKSRAEWLADYNKLTSPKDREAFRNAHKGELGLK